MKTHLGKFAPAFILSLAFIIPQYGYSQYDEQLSPSPPQDTVAQYDNPSASPDSTNRQLDQQEEQQTAPPSTEPVSTQVFYDQLSPYGQWVNYPNYGYVWIPSAGIDFSPYSTEGH